jgi:hypothetical protein
MATAIELLQGGGVSGVFCKSGKPVSNSRYKFIYFQEDSVISAFTSTTNVDEIALWNISGETIKAGTLLFAHNGEGIKNVTLSSGSAFLFDSVI